VTQREQLLTARTTQPDNFSLKGKPFNNWPRFLNVMLSIQNRNKSEVGRSIKSKPLSENNYSQFNRATQLDNFALKGKPFRYCLIINGSVATIL
jgi:uncharacterized protein